MIDLSALVDGLLLRGFKLRFRGTFFEGYLDIREAESVGCKVRGRDSNGI
jgi:hypothetical protein